MIVHRLGSVVRRSILLVAAMLVTGAMAQAREPATGSMSITAPQPQFFTINQVLAARNGITPPAPREVIGNTSALDAPFAGSGYRLFGSANQDVVVRWHAVRNAFADERQAIADCRLLGPACQDDAAQDFIAVSEAAARLNGTARLAAINSSVNARIAYATDEAIFGETDRWQTPLSALGGRGDCEDYAISKYFLLEAAGVARADMRIILARTHEGDHAVLSVKQGGHWLLLDNRTDRILADRAVTMAPVYALNEAGVDLYAAPFRARPNLQLARR